MPNPSGRVDQADQAEKQAAALHAAGVHHAGALHPAFIQPLVDGLSANEDEIGWAQRVLEAYDRLAEQGESLGELDGRVLDKFEFEKAKRTLDWAAACAAKNAYKARALERAQAAEALR